MRADPAPTGSSGLARGARLTRPRRTWGSLRRAILRRRRLLAAVLVAVGVMAGLSATRSHPDPTVGVSVAARDLPAGEVVGPDDLVVAELPPGAVPAGLAESPEGRTLAAPLRRGEPVTDVRLVGASMTAGRPELTALPVRLPDAGMAALLQVGDRIDLVAADPQAGVAEVVASAATVLALPAADDVTGPSGLPGRLVVIGVSRAEVTDVADATARAMVTFSWKND